MRRSLLLSFSAAILVVALAAFSWAPAAQAQAKPEVVTIGFQVIPNGEIVAKNLKWVEKEMGVKIKWVQFDSGRDVNTAMAAGSIDFGLVGSSPAAAGISAGVPYEVIWIHDVIGDNEALVVRKDRGINRVADLVGKKVAAPFGSTTHYHLLVGLKVFNVDPKKVTILDMQPPDMLAAWQRGDLDAGFVWEPTLIKMIEANGKVIVSSRELAERGFLTGDIGMVRKEFAKKYPALVSKYLELQNRAVALYRSKPKEAAQAVAKEFNIPAGEAERQMKTLILLSGKEQISEKYLGTSAKKGQLAKVFKETADFLVAQKTIKSAPPLAEFQKAVNPSYLEKALK